MNLTTSLRPLRILDFDIENRPLSYMGSDFTTGEITAIAWKVIGEPGPIEVRLLGEVTLRQILDDFVAVYNTVDVVTGHYIRGHDLPVISGALLEQGMAPLAAKLTQDTKLDLISARHVSLSQESLLGMLRVGIGKVHMTQPGWREANRLTPEGIAKTRRRVTSDVRAHIVLRRRLLAMGVLKGPTIWRP